MGETAPQRFYTALSAGMPDRVPVLPKIWMDLAAVLTGTEPCRIIEDPQTAMRLTAEAALDVQSDGARVFHWPARRTQVQDERLVEIDEQGRPLGPIDLDGGWTTRLAATDHEWLEDPYRIAFLSAWTTPEPLVRDLDDARRIAVPDRAFYEAAGYAGWERELIAWAGDRVALLGDCGSATLAFCGLLRGMHSALVDLIEQPALVHAMMEKGAEIAVERGKLHVDCGLRMLRLNDSPANMLVISPAAWRRFIGPHVKTVCDELHAYSRDVRIYCHVCGNVMPVLEDLVETGIDCIGPLDPLGGVTCAAARRVVGDRVALMGGVNALSFVTSTREQLIEEARRCTEGAGRRGYVLGSGCALPPGSRRENLLALGQAAELAGHHP